MNAQTKINPPTPEYLEAQRVLITAVDAIGRFRVAAVEEAMRTPAGIRCRDEWLAAQAAFAEQQRRADER